MPASVLAADEAATGVNEASAKSPLDYDATNYAEYYNVSLEDAKERLELQKMAGLLDGTLTAKNPETYSGLWIMNAPDFSVNVAFTTSGATELLGIVNDRLSKYLRVRQAEWTLDELLKTMETYVSTSDQPFDKEIDVARNQVVLVTTDAVGVSQKFADRLSSDGSRVALRGVAALSTPAANVYGGLSISGCTSGWGISRNTTGERGIVTAGHCPNSQSYAGVSMPFRAEATTGTYDSQWNARSTLTVKNWFKWQADGSTRVVNAKTNRIDMSDGMTVCKYGMTTNYTCGEITTKFYQPSACITGATATYIYVHREGVNMFDAGDSGGPVFLGLSAYGIGNCRITYDAGPPKLQDEIFMATDYVEFGLGITILTAP